MENGIPKLMKEAESIRRMRKLNEIRNEIFRINSSVKNRVKKEKEESNTKYTRNVSSFVGLLQQSENRHLLFLSKTVHYFEKQM